MRTVSVMLAASVSSCAALQLGAASFAPAASMRASTAAMQVPLTDSAEATKETPVPVASSQALDKLLSANPELQMTFKRAEFWSNQSATVLEVINVLGRFQSCEEFRTRTQFAAPDLNPREEDDRQAETEKRYQMAQRMGCAERVSCYQNVPKLPFADAALAASVGLTVEDFEGIEVTKAACNVVYDALAESRSGLIPYATLDERRARMVTNEGAFDEAAFRVGLYKSRALIILAWFLFGKGNFVWVLVSVKLLHDWRPDIVPSPVDMGLFKIGTFI